MYWRIASLGGYATSKCTWNLKMWYMGADSFSMADIAGFTIATAVSKSLPWDKLPRLAEWRDRIAQRPAVQQAMTVFDRV